LEARLVTVAAPTVDERVARTALLPRLLARPELGAVIGAVLVFAFFASVTDSFATPSGIANFLDPASTLGIMAVAVALLMIGGEFDLSAGVMTGSAGLITATLATEWDLNIWLAMAVALVFALAVGFFNGVLVMRTGLPSFIVTLGTFLMLQGLNLGITKLITGTVQVRGLAAADGYESAGQLFASTFRLFGTDFRVAVLWWIGITIAATWLLLRTRPGNWIFAVGGAAPSARSVGVPVARTKIGLFMLVSAAAWLVGVITALRLTSVQANAGIGLEFEFIIAAVIGGCLLTGGYGSAIGAAIGALIFGMTKQGIVYANWDSDWFKFFLGLMLLGATLVNTVVRRRAMRSKE
jgi:simple sugar transport system permease protein